MTASKNVTKKDLVEEIALRSGLTQVETKIIVEKFLDAVSNALIEGKNIEIRGFGRFKLKKRNARTARNPRTGDAVDIEAQVRPVFEPSRELNRSLEDKSLDKAFIDSIESEAP